MIASVSCISSRVIGRTNISGSWIVVIARRGCWSAVSHDRIASLRVAWVLIVAGLWHMYTDGLTGLVKRYAEVIGASIEVVTCHIGSWETISTGLITCPLVAYISLWATVHITVVVHAVWNSVVSAFSHSLDNHT